MLTTWGRVSTLSTALSALKPLPAYKAVIPTSQFLSRGLATATAPKKATSTATKKTTTTKATTAKAPAKKTATTASATKKAPAAKSAAKPTAKKTVSQTEDTKKPGRKAKTDEEKLKEHVKVLVAKALNPPTSVHPSGSTWLAFLKEKYATVKGTGQSITGALSKHGEEWSAEYKALTPAQQENLKAKAESTKGSNQQVLTDWVNKHTPAEIHQANIARAALRNLKAKYDPAPYGIKAKNFPAIPDERYPLRPRSPNILYIKEKLALLPKEKKFESLPQVMKEYMALSDADKQKWKDLAAHDLTRYYNELKAIGIEPNTSA